MATDKELRDALDLIIATADTGVYRSGVDGENPDIYQAIIKLAEEVLAPPALKGPDDAT